MNLSSDSGGVGPPGTVAAAQLADPSAWSCSLRVGGREGRGAVGSAPLHGTGGFRWVGFAAGGVAPPARRAQGRLPGRRAGGGCSSLRARHFWPTFGGLRRTCCWRGWLRVCSGRDGLFPCGTLAWLGWLLVPCRPPAGWGVLSGGKTRASWHGWVLAPVIFPIPSKKRESNIHTYIHAYMVMHACVHVVHVVCTRVRIHMASHNVYISTCMHVFCWLRIRRLIRNVYESANPYMWAI